VAKGVEMGSVGMGRERVERRKGEMVEGRRGERVEGSIGIEGLVGSTLGVSGVSSGVIRDGKVKGKGGGVNGEKDVINKAKVLPAGRSNPIPLIPKDPQSSSRNSSTPSQLSHVSSPSSKV
jgi:hypothetical protein